MTPADAYFGSADTIIKQRERIKRQTIEHRRLQHRKRAAEHQPPDEADAPLIYAASCAKCSDDEHAAQFLCNAVSSNAAPL